MKAPFKPLEGWYVYVLRCADNTLYTGITTDVTRRLGEHNRGEGAKYTRCRTPVTLLFVEKAEDRSSASRRERDIKRLTRRRKLELVRAASSVASSGFTEHVPDTSRPSDVKL